MNTTRGLHSGKECRHQLRNFKDLYKLPRLTTFSTNLNCQFFNTCFFLQVYSQTPYNPYFTSQSTRLPTYSAPSYQSSYSQYQQPLAFAASHPAQVSYAQPLNNYAYSSLTYPPQYYAQQIPFNHYAFGPAQPINSVHHAQPVASSVNSYQTPASTFFVSSQQIHKIPYYNQQPQTFSAASTYQPSNYHQQHVKQLSSSLPPRQISISKPVALESPIVPTSSLSSHVEHNHGAVSYAHVSSGERKPGALPLIASQAPQQVYYHQQPQTLYNGDYNKQSQYAVPISSNYYPTHYGNVPYAQVQKIPTAAASTLIPSIATSQKIVFH